MSRSFVFPSFNKTESKVGAEPNFQVGGWMAFLFWLDQCELSLFAPSVLPLPLVQAHFRSGSGQGLFVI